MARGRQNDRAYQKMVAATQKTTTRMILQSRIITSWLTKPLFASLITLTHLSNSKMKSLKFEQAE